MLRNETAFDSDKVANATRVKVTGNLKNIAKREVVPFYTSKTDIRAFSILNLKLFLNLITES